MEEVEAGNGKKKIKKEEEEDELYLKRARAQWMLEWSKSD